ncbi:hypothetical protein BRC64_07390 [Halobacteriales archaeon QH_10_67_22]|nr:MAG: hypothetical protein BRC64_07390 [Halobacteriales archaeon QH_10_67_22]
MSANDFLVLDSTVISNVAYTDSLTVVGESFPEVRVSGPVVAEIENGYRDGHEFLENALRYLPAAKTVSSDSDSRISRALSFTESQFRSASVGEMVDFMENHMTLPNQEGGREFDSAEATRLMKDCLDEVEVGEASAIQVGYMNGVPVATDDQDARELARRYDIRITGSIGVLRRCVHEGHIDTKTANEWLRTWIEENGYYAPISDITDLD